MSDRMQFKTFTDPNRQHCTIELWMNDIPLGHMHLDAAMLEDFIHQLARHRASLIDQVPHELDPGSRLEAIVDPVWRIPGEEHHDGRVLALRHPGLGWLSFLLPNKEAAGIAEWLTKDLDATPAR